MKLKLPSLILGTILGLYAGPLHAVPQSLTFHGRITVDQVNFTGTGAFRFALVNADGNVTYWSNDGTSVDGGIPSQSVSLEVLNGFYRVILGDDSLANMTAVPNAVFDADDVYLRVWFDDGQNGVQQLAPDQEFTSVGYAMKAGSVDAASITAEMIVDGAVTADKLDPQILEIESGQLPADPEFDGIVKADGFEGDGSDLTDLPVFDYNSAETRVITDAKMKIGGQEGEPRAQLHVEARVAPGSAPENHVMLVKNTNSVPNANGIAVVLENRVNGAVDNSNNYMSFYDGDERMAGRIEGMSNDNIKLVMRLVRELEETFLSSFGLYEFKLEIEENENWFDPGAFPRISLSDGELPSIRTVGGELPSIAFDRGALPTASFNRGQLPTLAFNRGQLPSASFSDGEAPSLSFTRGSLPSLSLFPTSLSPGRLPTATLDPGQLPTLTFNDGQLPSASLNGGRLPSLTFSGGRLPKLELDPGALPTVILNPGELPKLEVSGGRLPSINDLPFELKELALCLDERALARLLKEFGNDLDLLKKAWRMFHDPVCAAIVQSQIAFEGSGVTYESGAGDYAEWLERIDQDQEMRAGDIVGVFGGKISKKTAGADQVLVISYRPIVLGNMPKKDKKLYEKVAFMGQVPVRVIGQVKKGDYIIPTGTSDGTGRAISPDKVTVDQLNKVVGVSWADSTIEDAKYVKIIVGLQTNAYAKAFTDQQKELTDLRNEITSLKAHAQQVAALEAKLEKVMAFIAADQPAVVTVSTK